MKQSLRVVAEALLLLRDRRRGNSLHFMYNAAAFHSCTTPLRSNAVEACTELKIILKYLALPRKQAPFRLSWYVPRQLMVRSAGKLRRGHSMRGA